jgi:benzoate/toluate 1,2-dioxygenase reductase subunit
LADMTGWSSGRNDRPIIAGELLGRRWLSRTAFELELGSPVPFKFLPGQRIRLVLGEAQRDYSLVSSPADETIRLCVRRVEGGIVSSSLAVMEPSTPLHFIGPLGYFIFRSTERLAVFVATGTGVAPFVSMSRAGTRDFLLLHGVRWTEDLFYESDLRRAAVRYIPCVSGGKEEETLPQDGFVGRVTQYLAHRLPKGHYDFYVCGRGDMIRDVTRLVDERFPGSLLYSETFY